MEPDRADGEQARLGAVPRRTAGVSPARRWTGLAIALLGLPALTVVLKLAGRELSLGSVLLLYLLAVVTVAAVGGVWPGVLAAGASVFTANWFLTPPYHTLAVANRDSVVELVVFAVVALIVSLTVDISARDRARAGRSELEARSLSGFAAQAPADVSLTQVLENVRSSFGMTSASLMRAGGSTTTRGDVIARVGPEADGPASVRVSAGSELVLVAHGPQIFAEDRRVLERLAAAAARAWENQRLAAQADRLAGIDRARSALLAAVGHDLRTPLAGLKVAVSSLRQDEVTWSAAEQEELLATIDESSERLGELIENLLDMSRLQAGGVTAHPSAVAVDEVVSRAVIDANAEDVVMDIPDDLPLVWSDPGLLERVVANLVENARRHSPPDKPTELTARADGGRVTLHIADHGPGVPEDKWRTMFVPFQRLDDHTADAGLGLGLAIVKGFCEAMGVVVVPSVTPRGGLTMTLDILAAPR